MSGVVTTREHAIAGGLLLHVAAELRRGEHPVPGEPFAIAVTDERGLAIGLCDGTGDWGDGHRGSRIAVETMVETMIPGGGDPTPRLRDAMLQGGLVMCQKHAGEGWPEEFPPTCLASMLYVHDRSAHVAWIGDGPVFLVRGGDVFVKTRPHLLVDHAIAVGHLTAEQAQDFPHKDVLCRVLGGHGPGETAPSAPDTIGPMRLLDGDRIVQCYRRVARLLTEDLLLAACVADRPTTKLLDLADDGGLTGEAVAVVVSVHAAAR